MIYENLPQLLRSLVLFWVLALILMYAFNAIRSIQIKRDKSYIIVTLLGVAVFYFLYQVLIDIVDSVMDGERV